MKIQVRQYQENDLTPLMNVWEQANALAHPFLDHEFVEQVRTDIPKLYIPNSDTWVAEYSTPPQESNETSSVLVGFISLLGSEVGAIFVLPEFHGKGIGQKLMDKARSLRGELEVEVFKENALGRSFYEKYGFVDIEEKHHAPSGQQVLRLQYT